MIHHARAASIDQGTEDYLGKTQAPKADSRLYGCDFDSKSAVLTSQPVCPTQNGGQGAHSHTHIPLHLFWGHDLFLFLPSFILTWKDKKAKASRSSWSYECVCWSMRVRAPLPARVWLLQFLGLELVCFKAPFRVYHLWGEQWKVGSSL